MAAKSTAGPSFMPASSQIAPAATASVLREESERVIKWKSEKPRVLSDHGRGDNVEHVFVGLKGNLLPVLRQQFPEIAVLGVLGHFFQDVDHSDLAPVVGSHDEQAR